MSKTDDTTGHERLPNVDGIAEQRAARRLGIPLDEMRALALDIWGTTLTAHRDSIAGPDATSQQRGIVTRGLVDELRTRYERKRAESFKAKLKNRKEQASGDDHQL